jgi:hypothetical protein
MGIGWMFRELCRWEVGVRIETLEVLKQTMLCRQLDVRLVF